MKKALLSICLVLLSLVGRSENNEDLSALEEFNASVSETLEPIINKYVAGVVFASVEIFDKDVPFVLIWLVFAALFFTIYFGFINVRGFKHAINIVRDKYEIPGEEENASSSNQVSHFQALTTALSGTVGLGNIAGVAVAVSVGGPGATFWMIIAGLLGMSAKFVECTLGVKYRFVGKDGEVSGGPMYYLKNGLKEKGLGRLGIVLSGLFAFMCIGGSFGGGNMFQVNQARAQFGNMLGETSFWSSEAGALAFGIVMAIGVGVVIIGGIKSIANVTDKIVPFMCGIYVLCCIVILGMEFEQIPNALGRILSGAFSKSAAFGGILGVLIQGFKRAAFSNEAGIGSAAIAHSAVHTEEPVSEGLVALLEPFIDTVVVCTMTALVLVITGVYEAGPISGTAAGVQLTSQAFESVLGGTANIILTVAVVLFAFSTMISWSYYGLKSWTFLFGQSRLSENTYKAVFCLMVIVGSVLSLGPVIDFSDSMIFAMCFPNIIGLYILSGDVKVDLNSFLSRVKSGEIKTK